MYSIGQLAKLSNITVRTLRYYDEIGLLKPSVKSEGGHRQYTEENITKLHNIMILKEFGLPLETIHEILKNKLMEITELLHLRLKMIQSEREKLEKMELSIQALLDFSLLENETKWIKLFESINSYPTNKFELYKIKEDYFSMEEQNVIDTLPVIGDGSEQTNNWISLITDVQKNLNEDPKSEIAQKLAGRWLALVHKMYRGNIELSQKTWQLIKNGDKDLGFYRFDSKLVSFIDEAISHYVENSGRLQ